MKICRIALSKIHLFLENKTFESIFGRINGDRSHKNGFLYPKLQTNQNIDSAETFTTKRLVFHSGDDSYEAGNVPICL